MSLLGLEENSRVVPLQLAAIAAPPPSVTTPAGGDEGEEMALDMDFSLPNEYSPTKGKLSASASRSAEALALYARGMIHREAGDTGQAIATFRRVLALDPKQHRLANIVAVMLLDEGDVSKAIDVLKDCIKANPDQYSAYCRLAFIYTRYQRSTEDAIKYAKQAISIAPGEFETHATLYDIYRGENQMGKALQVLKDAATQKSASPEFWLKLGQATWRHLIADGQDPSPEETSMVAALYEKAASLAREDDIGTLQEAADFLVSCGEMERALAIYQKIIARKPGEMAARSKLASVLLKLGRREEAIKVLEETAQIDPQSYETFEQLGQIYLEDNNLQKALANFRICLKLNATDRDLYVKVAQICLDLKLYDEAVRTLENARRNFPDLPHLAYLLGLALSQAERYDESWKIFGEAEGEAKLAQRELLTAEFYFNYGAVAERSQRVTESADLFRKSIAQDPFFAPAYNYLGYMWIDRGEYVEEAASLVRRALELDPDNGAYLDSMGWYYFRTGDYQQALDFLIRAEESTGKSQEEESWEILDHIGDTYQMLGNRKKALEYWRRAAALEPKNTVIPAKIARAAQDDSGKLP